MDPAKPSKATVTALDIILSCHICQASISDIYGDSEGASDFHDGRPETSDRRVTSLWLTSCMHLTCGKHLEGGGAPFHPKGQHPQAPCPYCVTEKNDRRSKALYAVRGWENGQFDQDIPEIIFVTPPVKLEGQGLGTEALRFQYLSLIRYGTAVASKCNELEQAKRKTERTTKRLEKEHRELLSENKELKSRLATAEKGQADVAKWNARMPQITHYLGLWPEAIAEIDRLRGHLRQLGYAVPRRDYSMETKQGAKVSAAAKQPESKKGEDHAQRNDASTPGMSSDAKNEYMTGRQSGSFVRHHPGYVTDGHQHEARKHLSESSSGKKRKHSEYVEEAVGAEYERKQPPGGDNRNPMPPPGAPTAHKQSLASLDPPTSFGNRQSPGNINGPRIQVCSDGDWSHGPPSDERETVMTAINARRGTSPSRQYFMSGAIQESPVPDRRPLQNMTAHSVNASSGAPPPFDQIVRGPSSAMVTETPMRIPHDAQISRQHDPYSDENVYQIRNHQPGAFQPGTFYPGDRNRSRLGEYSQPGLNRWQTNPHSTRGNKVERALEKKYYQTSMPHHSARPQALSHNPITPSSKRLQADGVARSSKHAASPFFMRGQEQKQSGLSPGLAGLSANVRVGSVSNNVRNRRMAPAQQDWDQPRSLNGLSFINEPRGILNEPLYRSTDMEVQRGNRDSVNAFMTSGLQLTNDGLFQKSPEPQRFSSSYFRSMQPPPRQPQVPAHMSQHHQHVSPMPPQSARYAPHYPARKFTSNDALNMVSGSRSHTSMSFYQNQAGGARIDGLPGHLAQGSRGLFSVAGGKRSVKR